MYLSFVHINSGKHSLAVLLNCIHMSYEWVCLLGPRITYIPRAKKFSGSLCQLHKIIALYESHKEEKKLSYHPWTFFLACSKQLLLEHRKKKIDKNNIHTSQMFSLELINSENYIQNENVEVVLRSWINKRTEGLVNERHTR